MSNLTQQSQPPQAAVDQIIGLYNQGQLEQTVSVAESLAKQYPNALILYDILGAAYMGLQNADKTIASYQKALQLNPNHTDAYNNMGMALYDQGRFNEAVESYQKAVAVEPDFADAHYNLGNALKQTGDLRQAIESYRASLAIKPNDAEVLLNYGNVLKAYGDFGQAIGIYEKALKIDPNSAAAQTNMDNADEEKAEIDKNVVDYAKIAKLESGSAEIVSFTGTMLKARGYPDAAIDFYKQAVKIKPDYAEAYFFLGNTLKEKGGLSAAIDNYKKAINIKPNFALAKQNLSAVNKLAIPAWHFSMMNDTLRNDLYQAAINLVICEGDFVLEIGTGSGLLSMMAANAGANSITTCEASEAIAKVAEKIICTNGYSKKINVINKMSTELIVGKDLPRKADIIISEILSSEFVGEGVRSTILDANKRLLNENGKMIPKSGDIMIALLENNEELDKNYSVEKVNGFDLSEFNVLSGSKFSYDATQKPKLLSCPRSAFHISLHNTQSIKTEEKIINVQVERNGICFGIIQWLKVQLFEDIQYENNPSEKNSHWPAIIYPFKKPKEVMAGQTLEINATLFEDKVWFFLQSQ